MSIRNLLALVVLIGSFTLNAELIDTTIIADGSPGPYSIGEKYLRQETIRVTLPDSSAVPPWTFISERNGILFSESIDSGIPVSIIYETHYYGIPGIYSLFPKVHVNPDDTSYTGKTDTIGSRLSLSENENLSISGYKSIGVAVGSFGQINLEQGLDVRIGGEIRPGTEISAHLSDQGTSLDGATREISEFDMIYVALTDPKISAVAGDQYIEWLSGGILSGQKKIKGLSASLHPGRFSVQAFGALSGGKFMVETFRGRNGMQGPYTLSGKGEPGLITPIGGTVNVRINGRELQEGEQKDFTTDYDFGSIMFSPSVLIKDDDLIRVEYEYKLFDYQRSLLGGSASYVTKDSAFSVKGVLWSEADNRNHPIDQELTQEKIQDLRSSGDKTPFDFSTQKVDPNDVPSFDAKYPQNPLYERIDSAGTTRFRYKPYNPLYPEDRKDRYQVWFSYTGAGQGEYIRDPNIPDRQVYRYVGEGKGDYTPRSPIPAPQRLTTGEVIANLQLDLLKAKVNVVGQDFDRNLFSSKDDSDNRGSSVALSLLAGKKQFDRPGLWLSTDYRYSSPQFTHELLNAFERYHLWDDSTLAGASGYSLWEASVGGTPVGGISTQFSYGQNRKDSLLVTDKVSNSTNLLLFKKVSLQYQGTLFRHHHPSSGYTRKETARIGFDSQKHETGLSLKEEWRSDSSVSGTGLIGGQFDYTFKPWLLRQSLSYSGFRAGTQQTAAHDTGYSVIWTQSIDHKLFSWWHVTGSGNYHYNSTRNQQTGAKNTQTTFLVDLASSINSSSRGFTSRQQYRTNSEKASTFTQIPVFAGKGLGTHIYDDSLKEYVPRVPGDYFMQQREIYDPSYDQRVRKTTFDLTWSFDPVKKIPGILNDLSWQGALFLEEHIDASFMSASSWAPGYHALKNFLNKSGSGPVGYADLSYRQDIEWNPKAVKEIKGNLFAVPTLRKIRSYQEAGIESGLHLEFAKNKWIVSDEVRYTYIAHDDTLSQDFRITDIHTVLSQRYRIAKSWEIYLKECIGWAYKENQIQSKANSGRDSTLYIQLNPGFSWRPFSRGWAEASYTLSIANLPSDIDYRMARGFSAGLSQVISISADVLTGEHFSIGGSYRGEMKKLPGLKEYEPPEHVFSIEVKAFL